MGELTVGRRGRAAMGAAVLGVFVLAGCNLGVAPVAYELTDPDDFDLPPTPTGMAAGDINADGDTDVVAVGSNGCAVLSNDGTGAFAIAFPTNGTAQTFSPSLADVDGPVH
jgi:hypothetical protein